MDAQVSFTPPLKFSISIIDDFFRCATPATYKQTPFACANLDQHLDRYTGISSRMCPSYN